jgi:hypothetical protein
VLGILLVDHVKLPVAADDFVISAAFFNGGSDFHVGSVEFEKVKVES